MFVLNNVPLSGYSTMRLGGEAKHLVEVSSKQDVQEAVDWAQQKELSIIMIGDGSNIVWSDNGFAGLVIVNRIKGFDVFKEDEENIYVTVGGGEAWDEVVERTVNEGWSGLEQLSLVPGTAGATPIQNVGAYGRETSEVLTTLEAYDLTEKEFVVLKASDCQFGYRTSRFKTTDRGRFLITNVTFRLTTALPQPPFYSAVESYFQQNNISDFTPSTIRQAVIAIRSAKLPDPKLVANCGSFFANPILDKDQSEYLRINFPDTVMWSREDGSNKVSAAWLIEQSGFKDYHDENTGMATWARQPLVLINESAHTTEQLLDFKQKIVEAVKQKFDIELVQEPELI